MEKIAIIGTGLMGASLGLAIKKVGLKDTQIVGLDLERSRANKAQKMGAVDKVERSLPDLVSNASLVFISTPVLAMKEVMQIIGPSLSEGALVTDTGGTKRDILVWAKEYLPAHVDFVGAHPMAGKETQGPEHADATIFQGRPYCIVPSPDASTKSVKSIMDLATAIGARPHFIDVAEHDSFVAAVSHLPFVVSAALIGCTSKSPQWGDISQLASSGFRDVSRLASGDSIMHRDVCLTNKEGISYWIDELTAELQRIKRLINRDANSEDLYNLFENGFEEREKWLSGVTTPWSRADYERPKVPSATETASTLFFGQQVARRLFSDDESKDVKRKKQ